MRLTEQQSEKLLSYAKSFNVDRSLAKRMIEMAERSVREWECEHGMFLTPVESGCLLKVVRAIPEVWATSWGGYDDAERCVIVCCHEDMVESESTVLDGIADNFVVVKLLGDFSGGKGKCVMKSVLRCDGGRLFCMLTFCDTDCLCVLFSETWGLSRGCVAWSGVETRVHRGCNGTRRTRSTGNSDSTRRRDNITKRVTSSKRQSGSATGISQRARGGRTSHETNNKRGELSTHRRGIKRRSGNKSHKDERAVRIRTGAP